MKVSQELRCARIDRPDEWKMDDLIRQAEMNEDEAEEVAAITKLAHQYLGEGRPASEAMKILERVWFKSRRQEE